MISVNLDITPRARKDKEGQAPTVQLSGVQSPANQNLFCTPAVDDSWRNLHYKMNASSTAQNRDFSQFMSMSRPEGDDTTKAQGDTSFSNYQGHTKGSAKMNFLGTPANVQPAQNL